MDRVAERQYRHLAKRGTYASLRGIKPKRRQWKYARPHKGYGWFAGHNSWYALRGFSGWITKQEETLLHFIIRRYKLAILVTTLFISAFLLPVGVGYAVAAEGYSQPVSCTGEYRATGAPCQDPVTLIWQRLDESSLTDWNIAPGQSVIWRGNCDGAGHNCLQETPTLGNNSVAIENRPIGDLSLSASKVLAFIEGYILRDGPMLGSGPSNSWGFFITSNATAPAHAIGGSGVYDANTDPNVIMSVITYCTSGTCGNTAGSATYSVFIFVMRRLGVGDTLSSEDTGTCGSTGSCILSASFTQVAGCGVGPCTTPNAFGIYLNYTGATNAGSTCSVVSNVFTGPTCSWAFAFAASTNPVTSNGASGTQTLPPNPFTGSASYFIGLFSRIGSSFALDWTLNPAPAIAIGGTTGVDAFAYVPSPTAAIVQPNLDGSNWLQGAWNHYINGWHQICNAVNINSFCSSVSQAAQSVGGDFVNAIFQGLLAAGSAILSALTFFESLVKGILNVVGVAFGFPNSSNCAGGGTCGLGDDIFTFINSVITLFTTQVPNAFAQIANIFNGWINSLIIVFTTGVIGQIFAFLSSILTFGANIIVFAFGLFTTGLQWTTLTAPFWLFIWFFAFNADEGMNGWIRWFEFAKWLAFDIGVKFVTNVINWTIDVITAAMALLPKPFVQIAGKFPRLPIIEIHGVFSVPNFDGRALREGNLFSILGMMFGFIGFVWYELTQTSIPGTLANQFSTQPWVQTASTAITFYKLFLPMGVLVVFLLMIPTLFTSIFGVVVPGPSVGFPKVRGTGPSRSFSVTGGSGRLFRARAPGRRSQAFIQRRLEKSEETRSTRLRNQREEEAREKAENERLSRQAEERERQRGQELVRKDLGEIERREKQAFQKREKALEEDRQRAQAQVRRDEERFT